jgi:26S proteasome regulatory subunit N2
MCNSSKALEVLNPYLTGGAQLGGSTSPYATAGAHFAYGLINANQFTPDHQNHFMDGFRNSGQNETIQHGLSLGLGLVSMATKDEGVYKHLKDTLFNNADSAIIGEAAACGMGLVMVGSGDEQAIEEMMSHAADSNHEKIIRALGISLSLIMYGKESQADGLIE